MIQLVTGQSLLDRQRRRRRAPGIHERHGTGRAVFGVEPICAVLPIAPSTYHRHRHQRTHPPRRSARAQRNDQLRVEIQRVYDEHQPVYRPRKVWKQLRRDGVRVARLMRAMGPAGAIRGRAWVTVG